MANAKTLLMAGILAGVGGLSATEARADYYCTSATITEVNVDKNGLVAITTTPDPAYASNRRVSFSQTIVCNLYQDTTVTPPIRAKACEKMHAQLMAAQLSGRPLTFWFTGASTTSCPTPVNPFVDDVSATFIRLGMR